MVDLKIAHEVPIPHLESFPSDFHFILAHLAKTNQKYFEYYKNAQGYKILDNGVYETGEPMQIIDLIQLAYKLKVDEIVLPDFLKSFARTFRELLYCLHETVLNETVVSDFNWMVVPQAYPVRSWNDAYLAMTEVALRRIPARKLSVGMPVWLDSEGYKIRARLVAELQRDDFWNTYIRHHLLGVNRIDDIQSITPLFHSLDTSLPFRAAIEEWKTGWALNPLTAYQRPKDYFNQQHPPEVVSLSSSFMKQFEAYIIG